MTISLQENGTSVVRVVAVRRVIQKHAVLNHDGDRLTATEEGESSGSRDAVVELLDACLVHVWFSLQLVLVAYEACPPQSYVVTELNL